MPPSGVTTFNTATLTSLRTPLKLTLNELVVFHLKSLEAFTSEVVFAVTAWAATAGAGDWRRGAARLGAGLGGAGRAGRPAAGVYDGAARRGGRHPNGGDFQCVGCVGKVTTWSADSAPTPPER